MELLQKCVESAVRRVEIVGCEDDKYKKFSQTETVGY
jgi:hypothetical protein